MSHQGVPATFFDWCKRRQINSKSLSYCFKQPNERGKWEYKISKKASKVMKQVLEQLKTYCGLDCRVAGVDLFSNILNACQILKKLVVIFLPADNIFNTSNTLTLSCIVKAYLLMVVNLSRVSFHERTDSFHKFVGVCSHLEKVKFEGLYMIYCIYSIIQMLRTQLMFTFSVISLFRQYFRTNQRGRSSCG